MEVMLLLLLGGISLSAAPESRFLFGFGFPFPSLLVFRGGKTSMSKNR